MSVCLSVTHTYPLTGRRGFPCRRERQDVVVPGSATARRGGRPGTLRRIGSVRAGGLAGRHQLVVGRLEVRVSPTRDESVEGTGRGRREGAGTTQTTDLGDPRRRVDAHVAAVVRHGRAGGKSATETLCRWPCYDVGLPPSVAPDRHNQVCCDTGVWECTQA